MSSPPLSVSPSPPPTTHTLPLPAPSHSPVHSSSSSHTLIASPPARGRPLTAEAPSHKSPRSPTLAPHSSSAASSQQTHLQLQNKNDAAHEPPPSWLQERENLLQQISKLKEQLVEQEVDIKKQQRTYYEEMIDRMERLNESRRVEEKFQQEASFESRVNSLVSAQLSGERSKLVEREQALRDEVNKLEREQHKLMEQDKKNQETVAVLKEEVKRQHFTISVLQEVSKNCEDYKLLLKHVSVKFYCFQWRQYRNIKQLHQQLTQTIDKLYSKDRGDDRYVSLDGSLRTSPPSSVHTRSSSSSVSMSVSGSTPNTATMHINTITQQNEIEEWWRQDRTVWRHDTEVWKNRGEFRRDSFEKIENEVAHQLNQHYLHTNGALVPPTPSSRPKLFTHMVSVASHLSAKEIVRLRQFIKKEIRDRLSSDEQEQRVQNPLVQLNARATTQCLEAPALLMIALDEFVQREHHQSETIKTFQNQNINCLLQISNLKSESDERDQERRAEQEKIRQLQSLYQSALENTCLCSKLHRCVCDCIYDCTCAKSAHQHEEKEPEKHTNKHAHKPSANSKHDDDLLATTPFITELPIQSSSTPVPTITSSASSRAAATTTSPNSVESNDEKTLSHASSRANLTVAQCLAIVEKQDKQQAQASPAMSTSSSHANLIPLTSASDHSPPSSNASSTVLLHRVIKTLRTRLQTCRNIIVEMQEDKAQKRAKLREEKDKEKRLLNQRLKLDSKHHKSSSSLYENTHRYTSSFHSVPSMPLSPSSSSSSLPPSIKSRRFKSPLIPPLSSNQSSANTVALHTLHLLTPRPPHTKAISTDTPSNEPDEKQIALPPPQVRANLSLSAVRFVSSATRPPSVPPDAPLVLDVNSMQNGYEQLNSPLAVPPYVEEERERERARQAEEERKRAKRLARERERERRCQQRELEKSRDEERLRALDTDDSHYDSSASLFPPLSASSSTSSLSPATRPNLVMAITSDLDFTFGRAMQGTRREYERIKEEHHVERSQWHEQMQTYRGGDNPYYDSQQEQYDDSLSSMDTQQLDAYSQSNDSQYNNSNDNNQPTRFINEQHEINGFDNNQMNETTEM